MYGDPFVSLKYRLINMSVDDLKEIPITLENTTCVGSLDNHLNHHMHRRRGAAKITKAE